MFNLCSPQNLLIDSFMLLLEIYGWKGNMKVMLFSATSSFRYPVGVLV